MTDQPTTPGQGGTDDPGAALAAVRADLTELRDDLTEAQSTIAGLHSDVTANNGAVATLTTRAAQQKRALAELTTRVDKLVTDMTGIAATLTQLTQRQQKKKPPAAPFADLTGDHADQARDGLQSWVDGVLRIQYPSYDIEPCWLNHADVIHELAIIAAEWTRIYGQPGGTQDLEDALEFHDRWLPNAHRRIQVFLKDCGDRGCSVDLRRRGHVA